MKKIVKSKPTKTVKKMKVGGTTSGDCKFGQCWDPQLKKCVACASSTYGTLGAVTGSIAAGAKMIYDAAKDSSAQRTAVTKIKKENNISRGAARKIYKDQQNNDTTQKKRGGAVKSKKRK